VLLGDVLELRQGPPREALAQAQPALRAIAGALGDSAQVVVVPGNHDHHLLAGWLERRALEEDPHPLGLDADVDWRPGELLGELAEVLGSGRLRVAYPGAWLSSTVYATHGHYGDRHTTLPILERLGAGTMARLVGEPAGGPARAEDYEATLAPLYAWIDAIARHGGAVVPSSAAGFQGRLWQRMSRPRRRMSRLGTVAALRTVVGVLNRAGIGPLRADLSGAELRRAALRAFAEVLRRLAVSAPYVVFGHTHRAGPLPRDDRGEWTAGQGTSLLNTGSWVHEPAFLGQSPHHSPYRAGFCAVLGDDGPPRLTNLLEEPISFPPSRA
jgi:hypothetical protein